MSNFDRCPLPTHELLLTMDRRGYRKFERLEHIARDVRNLCINCRLPGHSTAECNLPTKCWNCTEYGHQASLCPNEPVCQKCGRVGHQDLNCPDQGVPSSRLCKSCYKLGHDAVDCTNEEACSICRKVGHFAHQCLFVPLCNLCNLLGHMAQQCPKSGFSTDTGAPKLGLPTANDEIRKSWSCANCSQLALYVVSCDQCGGKGYQSWQCSNNKYPANNHVVCTRGESSPKLGLSTDTRLPLDLSCLNCTLPAFFIVICDKCGGRGHYSMDCPSMKKYIVNRYVWLP